MIAAGIIGRNKSAYDELTATAMPFAAQTQRIRRRSASVPSPGESTVPDPASPIGPPRIRASRSTRELAMGTAATMSTCQRDGMGSKNSARQ